MATDKKVFTLRIQEEVFDKIKRIADVNKRSTAMQIEYAIEIFIRDYEKLNGKVEMKA